MQLTLVVHPPAIGSDPPHRMGERRDVVRRGTGHNSGHSQCTTIATTSHGATIAGATAPGRYCDDYNALVWSRKSNTTRCGVLSHKFSLTRHKVTVHYSSTPLRTEQGARVSPSNYPNGDSDGGGDCSSTIGLSYRKFNV